MGQILAGTTLPGGELVAGMGGFLRWGNLGVDISDANSNYGNRLDVSRWMVQPIHRNAEVTHSGCMGAVGRRRVASDFLFRCEIAYDVTNPPEMLLTTGASVGLCFYIGDPLAYRALALSKRWIAPSALTDECPTICDSTGTEIVRQVVSGHGNSLLFLLPDQATEYQQYLTALRNRGWLA